MFLKPLVHLRIVDEGLIAAICGTWPIGWPGPLNTRTTRPLNGNCRRLGIPKRANYYTTSESVKEWTAYAPKLSKKAA
jgi:hypothetical protein